MMCFENFDCSVEAYSRSTLHIILYCSLHGVFLHILVLRALYYSLAASQLSF